MVAYLVNRGASTMSQSFVRESAAASCRPARWRHGIVPSAPILRKWPRIVGIWIERGHQRRALVELDDRRLNDVGLSRERARCEAAKPFWKR
jgi:uncharacterized protein YjiS (DUF1127 family)